MVLLSSKCFTGLPYSPLSSLMDTGVKKVIINKLSENDYFLFFFLLALPHFSRPACCKNLLLLPSYLVFPKESAAGPSPSLQVFPKWGGGPQSFAKTKATSRHVEKKPGELKSMNKYANK